MSLLCLKAPQGSSSLLKSGNILWGSISSPLWPPCWPFSRRIRHVHASNWSHRIPPFSATLSSHKSLLSNIHIVHFFISSSTQSKATSHGSLPWPFYWNCYSSPLHSPLLLSCFSIFPRALITFYHTIQFTFLLIVITYYSHWKVNPMKFVSFVYFVHCRIPHT